MFVFAALFNPFFKKAMKLSLKKKLKIHKIEKNYKMKKKSNLQKHIRFPTALVDTTVMFVVLVQTNTRDPKTTEYTNHCIP